MGRAKIAMEPITDNKKRKTTFNSRSNGMIKKARELAILCQVNVSVIIFTHDQETPKIFPPDHDKFNSLIDVYNRTNPESINRYTLLDYYKDRKMKTEEEVVRAKKKNLEAKFPSWFGFLDNLSEAGLRELALGLENKIVDVQSRIECLKNNQMMMQSWNPNLIDPIMKLNEDADDHNVIMMPPLYPEYHSMLNEYDSHHVVNDGENFSLEHPMMMPPDSMNEDHNVIMMPSLYPDHHEYDSHHVVHDGENFSPLMEQYYCFPPDHQSLQQQLFMSSGTFQ